MHIEPELTGNRRRVLVSDLSGKSNVLYKAAEMGIDVSGDNGKLRRVVDRIKQLEHEGFQFEAADGSFRLLLEEAMGGYNPFFILESYRVTTERDSSGELKAEATVRVALDGEIREATATGCGPVHALDLALRQSLSGAFECLGEVQLTDYKVRVLDADKATAAKVRVLIQSRDDRESWSTVGVSDNVIEASWQALTDAVNYKLHRSEVRDQKSEVRLTSDRR